MNRYENYLVEDFVHDLRFRTWVRNPSAEEETIWHNWVSRNPHKRQIIEEARAIVLSVYPVHTESISDAEINDEVRRILAALDEDEVHGGVPMPERKRSFRWLKIAASVSILLVAGWYGLRSLNVRPGTEPAAPVVDADNYMIERVNKSREPLLINLPDNSSVLLSENSLIRYPKEFAVDTRNVFLQGSAFFEVTKDPAKPFFVKADEIVAKVLGTSFEINTNPADRQIRVIVKTGTVRIYSNPDRGDNFGGQPNVVLTRNEQLIYKRDESNIQHTRLDSVSVDELRVPDTSIKFTGTPVADVFSALAKAYGVKINYKNANISGCSVTALFTDEPFALKLDLICRSIGVKYEMVGDQVTIFGNGCKS